MKKYLTPIIFSLIVLGLVVFAVIALHSPDKPATNTNAATVMTGDDLTKLQTGWDQGPADAKVVVVEYGDYQCPACGNAYPLLKQLLPTYKDRIRFVFKNYPLIKLHKNAQVGAEAAEAAGVQGKYWEMHDMLYEKQNEWAELPDPVDKFGEYAKAIGADPNQLKSEVRAEKYKDKIATDVDFIDQFKDNENLNIAGTPTFYVNGKKINLQTNGMGDLKAAIDSALNAK